MNHVLPNVPTLSVISFFKIDQLKNELRFPKVLGKTQNVFPGEVGKRRLIVPNRARDSDFVTKLASELRFPQLRLRERRLADYLNTPSEKKIS